MAMHVSPARLRDELTELWIRVDAGEHLVAAGVHQPPVLVRRLRRGDRGRHTTLTRFRRKLHLILREARHEPVIVTVYGTPTLWLGSGADPTERRSRRQRLPRTTSGRL